MSVYIVRLPRTEDAPPALVGIYLANSVEVLEGQVSAACAPQLCEYACAPHGCLYGVEVKGPGDALDAVPDADRLYAEQDDANAVQDALSDDWRELFSGSSLPQWTTFQDSPWTSPRERRDALAAARQGLVRA